MKPMRDTTDRFNAHVMPEPMSGCWLWIARIDKDGYGVFGHRDAGKWTTARAHRYSWTLHRGESPGNLCVLHKCDTPACVNPDHLFLGTNADNTIDMCRKGRAFQGEAHTLSKLTSLDVTDIKTRRLPARKFARLYKVSFRTIYNIWWGQSWKHLEASK